MSFGETCATMQSVFTCYAVPDKINGTVIEMWILPFYFYSMFPWARETIKSNIELNTSIKKYPPLQSRLNTDIGAKWRLHSHIRLQLAY